MSDWKTLIIKTTWLIMILVVTWLIIRQCLVQPKGKYFPMTVSSRDSLLTVSPNGCQHAGYSAFEVWFDTLHHVPACVAYELTVKHLDGPYSRSDRFERDLNVIGCPEPTAYMGTGFHRGHMAPASDLAWDSIAIKQSFLMTNICPQHRSLNEGGWARLEEKCREWTARDSALLIFTGPVIEQGMDTIAGSGVAIPRHFYKVVLAHCVRPMRVLAFIYPNGPSNGRLNRYVTTVDEVERLTGIDFFSALPQDEQQHIESACNLQVWLH